MKEQIKFEVSAKTARLIGRENISSVNGALLELIKNSYDADATLCHVILDIPFLKIEDDIEQSIFESILSKEDQKTISSFYHLDQGVYKLGSAPDPKESSTISSVLFKYNTIVVIDNGVGMTTDTMKNSWMRIGTNDKEINYSSQKGRIKTGAKGIGRFALDKLSTQTMVFTKNNSDKLLRWDINWNTFNTARNLSDVETTLETIEDISFSELIKQYIKDEKTLSENSFDTGTIIVMSPTRDAWSKRLFSILNSNVDRINPLNDVDTFNVVIKNRHYKEYSFVPTLKGLSKSDYDYKVNATFDGVDDLTITIERNELNVNFEEITLESKYGGIPYIITNDDYWNRNALKGTDYCKDNYHKPLVIHKNVSSSLKESSSAISKIGPLYFEFYFIKQSSGGTPIVNPVKKSKRQQFVDYSGIKIYRDNFKIRSYGDRESIYYDWIKLGERSQKSPAAVTDLDGKWRVEPYQVMGFLKIGRFDNPNLVDVANREGLEQNETYYLLVDLLETVFEAFEYDRQYFMREFDLLKKEKAPVESKTSEIIHYVTSDNKSKGKKEKEKSEYTKEQYSDAIGLLYEQKKSTTTAFQLLMALASSGLLTNTFAHEIYSVKKDLKTSLPHLKECVDYILNDQPFVGDDDFNPYVVIGDCEGPLRLLSSWVGVLMNSIKKDSLDKKVSDAKLIVKRIVDEWEPLLSKKHISCVLNYEPTITPYVNMSYADYYIIFNNFILNSAWFLDKPEINKRDICITIYQKDNDVIFEMENSGPPLDSDYINREFDIFELGVSTKEENGKKTGTGVGLWMLKQSVMNNEGNIYFHELKKGNFGFAFKLPLGEKHD